jgi:hypothetical protein
MCIPSPPVLQCSVHILFYHDHRPLGPLASRHPPYVTHDLATSPEFEHMAESGTTPSGPSQRVLGGESSSMLDRLPTGFVNSARFPKTKP